MDEQKLSELKALELVMHDPTADIALRSETKNLESIRWYLQDLSKRAEEYELANAKEFAKATKIAGKSLTDLLAAIKNK